MISGNHADAAAAVEKALRFDPNLSAIDRYTAGMIFYLQRDYERAIDSFKRAGYGSQGNGEFVTPLAMAYVRAGRIDEARATVAEAQRLLGGRDCLAAESLALMQVQPDGKAAFRSASQMMTEKVSVKGNLLCEQSENAFDRPDCGPVYRHANPADETTYAYMNSTKVFYFSPAQ